MESSKDVVKVASKIDSMQIVAIDGLKTGFLSSPIKTPVDRANFQVLPILMLQIRLQTANQEIQFLGTAKERFAVVGKRQRDHARPRDPTSYPAKHEAVLQFSSRRGGSECYRPVAVRTAKSFEPSDGMKDG